MPRASGAAATAYAPDVPEPDYVVLGTVPWESRWLIEQNLARALSVRRRVLYVEPALSPLTPFRYGLRHGSARDLRGLVRRRPRRDDAVGIVRPLALPPVEHPLAQACSRPLVRRKVAGAAARLGLERPVLVALRGLAPMRGALHERIAVYIVGDWLEAGAELIGKPVGRIRAELQADCEAADVVLCSSDALKDRLAAEGVDSSVFSHGFADDIAPRYGRPAPPVYRSLPRPLLLYAGGIDDRLDFELLDGLADSVSGGSLLLLGPRSPRLEDRELARLVARPNVHLLPAVDRKELPPFLAHADCLLMPYRTGEWAAHGSPLKLWEYLYAGPPIVASGYVDLRRHGGLVRFADDAAGFCAEVAAALADPESGRDERRELALANSWERRAMQLEELITARSS